MYVFVFYFAETCEPYHMLGDIKCPGDYSVISEEAGEFCKGTTI